MTPLEWLLLIAAVSFATAYFISARERNRLKFVGKAQTVLIKHLQKELKAEREKNELHKIIQ